VEEAGKQISVPSPAATTEDERTMAVLAQALQVVGGWIAPLVIFLLRRQSRFVSFHSLQVLFLHLVFLVINTGLAVFWIAGMFFAVSHAHGNNSLPTAVFLLFPLTGLGFMGMSLLTIVVAVVYAIKAGQGRMGRISDSWPMGAEPSQNWTQR
jgi:uncharacterized Tic20 family protein